MNRRLSLSSSILIALALLAGCGSGGSNSSPSTPVSYTYTSTTSRGDLVNYTITGSSAAIQWNVTDAVGVIDYTWNIAATCSEQDVTYGHRSCTIASAVCTAGATVCPIISPSGSFQMLEVPGTALIANIPVATASGASGSTRDELHAGFISGGCPTDVSGDYAYVMTGHPSNLSAGTDLFGVYRSDATFNAVTHADFGMETVGAAALNTAVADYATNAANPTGAELFTGSSCENGVFSRRLNGSIFRLNITRAGSMILDAPAGQGGLISFKTTIAATLADFAQRNWWGITFPDQGESELLSLSTGTVNAGAVELSGQSNAGGAISDIFIKPASGGAALSPANKFDAPGDYTASGNVLLGTYPTPANIPGLFQIDDLLESNIVTVASRVGSQVMLYGVVFNHRDQNGLGCAPGAANCELRNSGNFIIFSH